MAAWLEHAACQLQASSRKVSKGLDYCSQIPITPVASLSLLFTGYHYLPTSTLSLTIWYISVENFASLEGFCFTSSHEEYKIQSGFPSMKYKANKSFSEIPHLQSSKTNHIKNQSTTNDIPTSSPKRNYPTSSPPHGKVKPMNQWLHYRGSAGTYGAIGFLKILQTDSGEPQNCLLGTHVTGAHPSTFEGNCFWNEFPHPLMWRRSGERLQMRQYRDFLSISCSDDSLSIRWNGKRIDIKNMCSGSRKQKTLLDKLSSGIHRKWEKLLCAMHVGRFNTNLPRIPELISDLSKIIQPFLGMIYNFREIHITKPQYQQSKLFYNYPIDQSGESIWKIILFLIDLLLSIYLVVCFFFFLDILVSLQYLVVVNHHRLHCSIHQLESVYIALHSNFHMSCLQNFMLDFQFFSFSFPVTFFLQKKLAQPPAVDMKKVPGSFCCYSNHAPKLIQLSFDAQSLCRLQSDCAKSSTWDKMWSLDGSLAGACCMSTACILVFLVLLFSFLVFRPFCPPFSCQLLVFLLLLSPLSIYFFSNILFHHNSFTSRSSAIDYILDIFVLKHVAFYLNVTHIYAEKIKTQKYLCHKRQGEASQLSKKLEKLKQSKEDWRSCPGKICITRSKTFRLRGLIQKSTLEKISNEKTKKIRGKEDLLIRENDTEVILVVLVGFKSLIFNLENIRHETQTHYTLDLFSFKKLYERENGRADKLPAPVGKSSQHQLGKLSYTECNEQTKSGKYACLHAADPEISLVRAMKKLHNKRPLSRTARQKLSHLIQPKKPLGAASLPRRLGTLLYARTLEFPTCISEGGSGCKQCLPHSNQPSTIRKI
ncbi:hypothetical protein VP01_2931g2 [Puccinia sorghi]|uniref:Uncharacterized protein n=1 Tax=Puccinia sorghi TaxID=27349 RepID=A0A0L6V134_9BASI|nr:hypothetical protein VP01_2931g2 [Puccinia sorghi]